MDLRVFWIGKTRLAGIDQLTEEYGKRLSRYCKYTGEEVRSVRRKVGSTGGADKEEAAMLAQSSGTHRIVMDPAGKQLSSEQFAAFLGRLRDQGVGAVSFCVGGADGFSPEFKKQARTILSLSSLTMPHELARVVLLEQIYRAWTILSNHPYPR